MNSFPTLFGVSYDTAARQDLRLCAEQVRQEQGTWVRAEHQHRWFVLACQCLAWKSAKKRPKSAFVDNVALWDMLDNVCAPLRTIFEELFPGKMGALCLLLSVSTKQLRHLSGLHAFTCAVPTLLLLLSANCWHQVAAW